MNRLAACALVIGLGCWASAAMADPGRDASVQCYVWANNPTATAAYTPTNSYSYNAVGRAPANRVSRTSVGTYVVTCRGVGGGSLFTGSGTWGFGGHVQVTAYGSEDADYCKVASWTTGGAHFTANVRCYNTAGRLADSRFDLLFIW